ncbi:MAG: hypothetical protein RSG59_08210 [Ruthenibacterium sp.]
MNAHIPDENIKVSIGQSLGADRWEAAANDLEDAAPTPKQVLRRINFEGQGKKDAEDFENDILLATIALRYVAKFAPDKCRFIGL